MNNLSELWEKISATLMFCVAASILFLGYREFNSGVDIVSKSIIHQNNIYEQHIEEVKEEKTSYKELISLLIGDLSYDIKIDQIEINRDLYDFHLYDLSLIPKTDYEKSYEYDMAGNIVKLVYSSK